MNDDKTGDGGPVNKTTKVGTENVGYTVVASVRMHSEGSEPGYEEDKMICLAVKKTRASLSAGNVGTLKAEAIITAGVLVGINPLEKAKARPRIAL